MERSGVLYNQLIKYMQDGGLTEAQAVNAVMEYKNISPLVLNAYKRAKLMVNAYVHNIAGNYWEEHIRKNKVLFSIVNQDFSSVLKSDEMWKMAKHMQPIGYVQMPKNERDIVQSLVLDYIYPFSEALDVFNEYALGYFTILRRHNPLYTGYDWAHHLHQKKMNNMSGQDWMNHILEVGKQLSKDTEIEML